MKWVMFFSLRTCSICCQVEVLVIFSLCILHKICCYLLPVASIIPNIVVSVSLMFENNEYLYCVVYVESWTLETFIQHTEKGLIANCTVALNRDRMWFGPRLLSLCFNNVWSGILLFTPIHVCCLVCRNCSSGNFHFTS